MKRLTTFIAVAIVVAGISIKTPLAQSPEIAEAMAAGEGPAHAVVALGCAGWGAGQLEYELGENTWLTAPVDPELLFELPLERRGQTAAGRIGVDLFMLADYSGHA